MKIVFSWNTCTSERILPIEVVNPWIKLRLLISGVGVDGRMLGEYDEKNEGGGFGLISKGGPLAGMLKRVFFPNLSQNFALYICDLEVLN